MESVKCKREGILIAFKNHINMGENILCGTITVC